MSEHFKTETGAQKSKQNTYFITFEYLTLVTIQFWKAN